MWSGSPYENGHGGKYSYGERDWDFLRPISEVRLGSSSGSRHNCDTGNNSELI